MTDVQWAGATICESCKRMVRHRSHRGRRHRWHGCRLRWVARRVAHARADGWQDGYRFAVDHIEEPMVYADVSDYGSGWAGLRHADAVVIVD